ncbi:MAG: hypothetical protein AB1Z20_16925 [Desulfobacterales bacterium]
MESKYNQKAWEQETELGRRLYIHNFGMKGMEFDGWELVNTTSESHPPDESEKVYMWKRKAGKGEGLVQVRVVETNNWRNALQYHHGRLMQSMRSDIPRGKGKTAGIGDIQHVGQAPTNEVAVVVFTRGNLQISVSSVGLNLVDVTPLAKALDNRLTKSPTKTDEKKLTATRQKPLKVKIRKKEKTVIIDTLPEPIPSSGWTRVLATDGEIRKEGDTLYLVDEQGGDRTVEIINYKLE